MQNDATREAVANPAFDTCECGDYRQDHVLGAGACILNKLGHGGAPECHKFVKALESGAR